MLSAGVLPLNHKVPQTLVVASLTCSPSCQRRAGFVVPCDAGYQDVKAWAVAHSQITLFDGFWQAPGELLQGTVIQLLNGT